MISWWLFTIILVQERFSVDQDIIEFVRTGLNCFALVQLLIVGVIGWGMADDTKDWCDCCMYNSGLVLLLKNWYSLVYCCHWYCCWLLLLKIAVRLLNLLKVIDSDILHYCCFVLIFREQLNPIIYLVNAKWYPSSSDEKQREATDLQVRIGIGELYIP